MHLVWLSPYYIMPSKNVKKRNWTFIAYPDSLPSNWLEQLQQTGLKIAISPLHDRDVNADGSPKKPHYHVLLCYDGPQTYNAVLSLSNKQLGQSIPQALESMRGGYRYLTHKDNPDKAQYSDADIRTLNGFDIRDFVELTRSEITKIIRDIQDFIREEHITEYCRLLDMLQDGGDMMADWYEVAINHTLLLTAYLRSRREYGKIVDQRARAVLPPVPAPVASETPEDAAKIRGIAGQDWDVLPGPVGDVFGGDDCGN